MSVDLPDMASDKPRTEIDFDHHGPDYSSRGSEINAQFRAECPVAWSPHYEGFWLVTDYEKVAAISRDDGTFSSDHDNTGQGNGYGGVTIPPSPFRTVPIEMDPPEFNDYRKLLNPYFSPAAAARWRPYIEELVEQSLDVISERGFGDIVLDLANPVPAIFTLSLIGLPLDDWHKYADPAHEIVYALPDSEEQLHAITGCVEMLASTWEIINERQANPTNDFLSYLATARIKGELLDELRIAEMVFLLIMGGVDTTTGLTANALVWLERNPEMRRRLIAEPELMPKAIEEFLRYFTPVQTMGRTATRDTVLGDAKISASERVLMSFASANRDPAMFDSPEDLLMDRTPNRHASFGLGIHRCLGSNFARVLTTAMIEGVLRRMPDYVIDHEQARRYETIGIVNGWAEVPMAFSPTPSRNTPSPEVPGFIERGRSVAPSDG